MSNEDGDGGNEDHEFMQEKRFEAPRPAVFHDARAEAFSDKAPCAAAEDPVDAKVVVGDVVGIAAQIVVGDVGTGQEPCSSA